MLLLESVLEHGQPWVLLTALFFDQNFTSSFLKVLSGMCPRLCKASQVSKNPLWCLIRHSYLENADIDGRVSETDHGEL